MKKKKTVGETLSTWQEGLDAGGEGENIAARIILGICSLGLTEVGYGLVAMKEDADENKEIDKTIEKINDCISDLWREKHR